MAEELTCEECPVKGFCDTTRNKPEGMKPGNCPLYAKAVGTEMPEHEHVWKSSYDELGLVGNLYRWIYPFVCECGALRGADGTVHEPKPRKVT